MLFPSENIFFLKACACSLSISSIIFCLSLRRPFYFIKQTDVFALDANFTHTIILTTVY